MADEPLRTLEQLTAYVFAAASWLLYYEIGRDLFPGVPIHSYSRDQDEAVSERMKRLLDTSARKILPIPSPPPAPDDRGGGGSPPRPTPPT